MTVHLEQVLVLEIMYVLPYFRQYFISLISHPLKISCRALVAALGAHKAFLANSGQLTFCKIFLLNIACCGWKEVLFFVCGKC
jgi:hypothetical protein